MVIKCQVCKTVADTPMYACVARGNPKRYIPWVCSDCHEGCEGPFCKLGNN